MRTAAPDPLSTTLFAVADPTRRGILARLARGDATVKELAEPYAMSVAAISKHLNVLEAAGLVSRQKEAQFRRCHLHSEPLRAVNAWLDDYRRFWERTLDALDDHLAVMQRDAAATKPTRTSARAPRRRARKDSQ